MGRHRFPAVVAVFGLLAAACSLGGGNDEACGLDGASVARVWNEQALDAVRRDFPAPTVHARNLYHLSALAYDLFVAYDADGEPVLVDGAPSLASGSTGAEGDGVRGELEEAIAHGAHHLLTHRYTNATGAEETLDALDDTIGCYGPADSDAARFGIELAEDLIEATIDDGSRETSGYTDLSYAPVNLPMVVFRPGAGLIEPGRWQPLSLESQITQNGIALAAAVQ
ncbi:MAG: hypothetical protein AAFO29_25345, partial [Actinomycetota bacterium]